MAIGLSGTAALAGAPLPPSRPFLVEQPLPPAVFPPPASFGSAAVPAAPVPRARDLYFPMTAVAARQHGMPAEIADAVMRVESGYDPSAVGGVGERGLMQVLPSTAALLGFAGSADELADPSTNIRLGVRYLAVAWRLSGGDVCRALMKYRAGHGEERMSALSVEYCRRAKAHLAALGSPYGDGVLPLAEFGTAPAALASRGGARVARAGRKSRPASGMRVAAKPVYRFWAADSARIRAIESRLKWKAGGILAGT